MKLNAGIITEKLTENKTFYTSVLGFNVLFENEFYLLMSLPDRSAEVSFLLPNHPTQQPIFQKPFAGAGVYLALEVDNVDEVYLEMKKKNANIIGELLDEPWGDRHFIIEDPNGIGIDIVKHTAPKQ